MFCPCKDLRGQELCEGRGGRSGFPVPNKAYRFCGRKATLQQHVLINKRSFEPFMCWELVLQRWHAVIVVGVLLLLFFGGGSFFCLFLFFFFLSFFSFPSGKESLVVSV